MVNEALRGDGPAATMIKAGSAYRAQIGAQDLLILR